MMEDIKKEYKSKTIPAGLMQFENPYQNAWEELIRWLESEVDPSIFSDYSMWEVKSDKVIKRQVLEIINEISTKHGIGDNDVFKKLEIPIKPKNNEEVSKCSLYDSNQRSFLNDNTKTGVGGKL